jgi:hypothetical protein
MLRSGDMDDAYKGRFVRRWELVNGQPRCPSDPLDVTTSSLADVGTQLAINRAVRQVVASAEAYEHAMLTAAGEVPVQWVPGSDVEGEPTLVENPAWGPYQTALATIASASPAVLHLVRTRAAQLERDEAGNLAEEPFALDLPALPDFDATTETVDWGAAGWGAPRALSVAEAAILAGATRLPWISGWRMVSLIYGVLGEARFWPMWDDPDLRLIRVRYAGAKDVDPADMPAIWEQVKAADPAYITDAEIAAVMAAWPRS